MQKGYGLEVLVVMKVRVLPCAFRVYFFRARLFYRGASSLAVVGLTIRYFYGVLNGLSSATTVRSSGYRISPISKDFQWQRKLGLTQRETTFLSQFSLSRFARRFIVGFIRLMTYYSRGRRCPSHCQGVRVGSLSRTSYLYELLYHYHLYSIGMYHQGGSSRGDEDRSKANFLARTRE